MFSTKHIIFINILTTNHLNKIRKQQFIRFHNLLNLKKNLFNYKINKRLIFDQSLGKTPRGRYSYFTSFLFGAGLGLCTGFVYNFNLHFYLRGQDANLNEQNETTYTIDTGLRRRINATNTAYTNFPIKILLYQYETSPTSSQLRAYLDYFGFSYEFIEVDPLSKIEVKSITRRPKIPIVMLEHKYTHRKWYLTNPISIMSALETLRNKYDENCDNFNDLKYIHSLLQKYLPILKLDSKNSEDNLKYSNEYEISNHVDNINVLRWRKWINNTVIPVMKWNSCDNLDHTYDVVDMYKIRSLWHERFNIFKQKLLYYSFVYKLYKENKDYKNIIFGLDPNSFISPIETLHYVIEEWEESLKSSDSKLSMMFNGQEKPNLADIAMFGVVRAFDGCQLFNEIITNHHDFYFWYKNMKILVASNEGGKQSTSTPKKKIIMPNKNEIAINEQGEKQSNNNILTTTTTTTLDNINNNDKDDKELIPLRILSTIYLAHYLAFSIGEYFKHGSSSS